MAKKEKKPGKRQESGKNKKASPQRQKGSTEDFSVIIGGSHVHRDYEAEEKADKKKKVAGEEKNEEAIPEKAEAPALPEKKLPETLPELLKKREEIELFLASLENAHKDSKFPEYTYNKMKKNNENKLAEITRKVKELEHSDLKVPKGKVNALKIMEDVQTIVEKRLSDFAGKGDVMDISRKIESMNSALSRMPNLKNMIEKLGSELKDYEKIMDEINLHEKSMETDFAGLRKSVDSLRKDVLGKDGGGRSAALRQNVSAIDTKIAQLSKKMEDMFNALKKKVEEISVIEELEISDIANALKKEIDDVRSSMSGFVKKGDLERLVLRPVIGSEETLQEEKNAGGKPKEEPKAPKRDTIDIGDVDAFMNKEVRVEGEISVIKTIEEKGMKLYWYRMKDKTGEAVVASRQKISGKSAKISGDVRETKTGSIYIFLKEVL